MHIKLSAYEKSRTLGTPLKELHSLQHDTEAQEPIKWNKQTLEAKIFHLTNSECPHTVLPSPSMLVDSLSGMLSEVSAEMGVGGVIDLTLQAVNPCEV